MPGNILPFTEQKAAAARLSVSSNALLVVLKLLVGIAIGSVSVLSEAVHSGIDLLAALLAFFAVNRSGKPPDEEHEYGHGKIENVSGVVEAVLIFLAAVWIVTEAAHRLAAGAAVQTPLWGLVVMGLSGLVNLFISSKLMKTARGTDSIALEADAWHLRTDVFTSFGVAAGMLLIWITGRSIIDPILAIGVALLIVKASYDLTVKAFSPLLDARLPLDEEAVISRSSSAMAPSTSASMNCGQENPAPNAISTCTWWRPGTRASPGAMNSATR